MFGTSLAHARRLTLSLLAIAVVLTAIPGAVQAQSITRPARPWEILLSSGRVVPTGEQQDTLTRGNLSTVQVSRRVARPLVITGMFGWARSRARAYGDSKLDVLVYDLGAEARSPRLQRRVTLSGFAGVGAGGRTYSHRDAAVDAAHHPAVYASAGGEIGLWRVGLRLEVRDYVTRFIPFGGGAASTRNDMAVMAGVRIGRRQ